MSTDERVTNDLIETLKDGQEGFERAAQRLSETDRSDLCARFKEYSAQRGTFALQLQSLTAAYGDRPEESGSLTGSLHRGWMAVKDLVSGSGDADGVLDAAEQGEDHAVAEYEKALSEEISPTLRGIVEQQFLAVKAAHDVVRNARNAARN